MGKKGLWPATEVMCGMQPGFLRDRKCEIAICVTRIGCVMLMSIRAYRDSESLSFEGGVPGGCQKFDHSWRCVSDACERWDGTNRLVHSCAWTHNVCASEVRYCYLEHLVELCPICHICLLEDGLRAGGGGGGVLREQRLCFGTQSEVGDDDVAAFREEELCEAEVDTGAGSGDNCCLSFHAHCHCAGDQKEERRESRRLQLSMHP